MFFQIALYLFFGFLRVMWMCFSRTLSRKNVKSIWNTTVSCVSFVIRIVTILYALLRLLLGIEQTDAIVVQLATMAYKTTLALAATNPSSLSLSPRATAKLLGRHTLALIPATTNLALAAVPFVWAHRAEIASHSVSIVTTAVEIGCTVGCAVASLVWSTSYGLLASTSSYVLNRAANGVLVRIPSPL